MLVLAAEDYTGPTPADADGEPNYLQGLCRRLSRTTGSRRTSTTWMTATARLPTRSACWSHYEAVVWYTGDDYLTREPGQVPATGRMRGLLSTRSSAIRDYLNEGGKVLLAGKHAGQEFFEGYEFRNEGFPQPNEDKQGEWCDAAPARGTRRLHRPHGRLLPVLHGVLSPCGGRRLVERRDRRGAPRGRNVAVQRHLDAGRQRPGDPARRRADVDARVDLVARSIPTCTMTSRRSSHRGQGWRPALFSAARRLAVPATPGRPTRPTCRARTARWRCRSPVR